MLLPLLEYLNLPPYMNSEKKIAIDSTVVKIIQICQIQFFFKASGTCLVCQLFFTIL